MSINDTDRVHISFFGRRNVGKSSLVNAFTGQSLAVVSPIGGTTTDPVKKAMELLPIGPVMIIDTPGFDDFGELGALRVQKTLDVLAVTDIAVFVTDTDVLTKEEKEFLKQIEERKIPLITVRSKTDARPSLSSALHVSSLTKEGVEDLKNLIGKLAEEKKVNKKIVSDLLSEGDTAILVTPIDESAPKGRLILPQIQTIRDLLDNGCMAVICQPNQLKKTLDGLKEKPKIVITDSQVFKEVAKIVPEDIPLTSFSILFSRYKGNLYLQVKGAFALSKLKDGDEVLISEGCTHHRQCGDIGTVKLPMWIENFCGARPEFTFTSGGEFPKDLSKYKLIIHCGGCMLTETEMRHRISLAESFNAPIVNYGTAIAHMNGILKRSIEIPGLSIAAQEPYK